MSENGMQTQQITIQDWLATIPAPYTPGHALNENEAGAFNQLFAENIRNNYAKKVKDERELAVKENREPDFSKLQSDLDTYAASYEFGARKGGGGGDSTLPKDPILRAAHMISRDKIRERAKAKGIKLTPEQVAGLVPQLLEKNPSILEEARRQVEAEKAITIDDLELPAELPQQEASTETSEEASTEASSEQSQGKRKRKS